MEILPIFKLIKAFMVIFVTYKMNKIHQTIEGTRVVTTFFTLKVYGDFFQMHKYS